MPLAPAILVSSGEKTNIVHRLTAGNNHAFALHVARVYLTFAVDDALLVRWVRHLE
jgi:hypothetical protein